MGLDQFLSIKKSFYPLGANAEDNAVIADKIRELAGLEAKSPFASSNGLSVMVPAGYWRKANQIHGWVLREAMIEEDTCEEIWVDTSQLESLLKDCRKVLSAKDTEKAEEVAEEILPTESGFFFGGTEYDEYYYEQLEHTIEIINYCLDSNPDDTSFVYQASW